MIIQENIRRNQILDQFYDPLTGEGSQLERQLFEIEDFKDKLYLPKSMMNVPWIQQLAEAGNKYDFLARHMDEYEELSLVDDPTDAVDELFFNLRLDHDFEFYAITCLYIFNKDTFKEETLRLRGAQRKLLSALEEMRVNDDPIRIVLLKARQWGGSTLIDMYAFWLQQRHRINWHMAICAQDDASAGNISSMYDFAIERYPMSIGKLVGVKGSSKNRKDNVRGGRINIGSVNNPKQFRGYNNAIVHMSETGVWEDTPKRSSMRVVASLKETVPNEPYTMIVEESTANGLNYFHDSWLKAVKGETRYKAVFVAWHEIDRCRIKVEDSELFYKSLSDYELFQWNLGATLEGIAWYRKHKADNGYSDYMMMEENPSTPEEAFQSSGQKVFAPNYVLALSKDNKEPIFTGEVFADARTGKKALDNIRFEPVPNGFLRIWEYPESQDLHNRRYVVSVDIGGRTQKADYSVIRVIDRIGMLESYKPHIKIVLTWKGHTDQDILSFKAAQIAKMYHNALLIVEGNALDSKEEGNHFQTVLDQLKDHYDNLYIRNMVEKVGNDFIPKYGWWTTDMNKSLAIDALNAVSRERLLSESEENSGYILIDYDKEACNEMLYFETKPNGKQGAISGKHDDMVMTTAIGVHVSVNELPLPSAKRKPTQRPTYARRTESSF